MAWQMSCPLPTTPKICFNLQGPVSAMQQAERLSDLLQP